MNPREREELSRFLRQLTDVRLTEKDVDAEVLIREAVARQPDAAYLLVQRALLVEQALNAAKARITELQQVRRADATNGAGSFLGGRNPWAPPVDSASASAPVPGANSYHMPSGPAAAPAAGGGSSFLGNVATTAAGVVAGSFLFQGLESLLGHHQGLGSPGFDPASEHLSEQTVVNNYYGEVPDGDQPPDNVQDAGLFYADDSGDAYPDDPGDDGDWI